MGAQYNTFERTFAGARSTFQRLSDAKILHGWTERMEGYGVVIRAAVRTPLNLDDRFLFRLNGRDGDAVFTARLSTIEPKDTGAPGNCPEPVENLYSFKIEGSIQMVKALTEARFDREHGVVVIDGRVEGRIKDISKQGLGILTQEAMIPKSRHNVTIYADMNTVEAAAEVRYCRKVSADPNTYRVGLMLADLDRINTSRWNVILQSAA